MRTMVRKRLTYFVEINPLSVKPTKWSNTLKQFVGKLHTVTLTIKT